MTQILNFGEFNFERHVLRITGSRITAIEKADFDELYYLGECLTIRQICQCFLPPKLPAIRVLEVVGFSLAADSLVLHVQIF